MTLDELESVQRRLLATLATGEGNEQAIYEQLQKLGERIAEQSAVK